MFLTSLLTVLSLCGLSHGYMTFQDRLPNGNAVPHPCKPNYIWHGVGHENAQGGGARNPFGLDFKANGLVWNSALCQMDSDGDGLTNGQELGDPQCTWTSGNIPSRTANITHPGVCTPWNSPSCQGKNDWVDCDVGELECDVLNDPATRNITIRFPETPVPNTETNYVCMTFDLPGDAEYHIVATKPFIDNAYVMHHILVYGCDGAQNPPEILTPSPCSMEGQGGCNNLIGLWTVGYPGNCINQNTGFRFGSGAFTRVKMEMHWNNPELRADYTDSSGMTLFYTPNLRPTSAVTMTIGQAYLEIPPLQPIVSFTGTCSSKCTSSLITEPITVIEASNHMHYLGKGQNTEVFRNGVKVATLAYDEVYNYDSPVAHVLDPPVQILPGDEIRTTCTFNSQNRNYTTYYGEGTSEEMCFAFLTAYPKENLLRASCVSYKENTYCPGGQPGNSSECDHETYLDPSNQRFITVATSLWGACNPFGPCTPACKPIVNALRKHACFNGPAYELTKEYLKINYEGMYLLSLFESCLPKPQEDCPACPNCPINNQNTMGDPTGAAAAMLPGLLSVLALTSASMFL